MQSQRSRALRAAVLALAAWAAAAWAAAVPAPARAAAPPGLESSESKTFRIDRTAGTCPAALTVATRAKGYEGGAVIDIVARTKPFASAPRVAVKTPSRVEFTATMLPAYAACAATARFSDAGNRYQLALRRGTMRLIVLPSAELTLLGTSVASGNPSVKLGVAD